MTQSFEAQVRNWSEKAKRNAAFVVAEAAQDVFAEMSERQPSIKETGTFEVGKVPVDDSDLINSLFTSVNGVAAGEGETSYVAAMQGFDLGDEVTFAFSVDHAIPIEYGTSKFPGRFMVRTAINGAGGWQARVDASAAKFKDEP